MSFPFVHCLKISWEKKVFLISFAIDFWDEKLVKVFGKSLNFPDSEVVSKRINQNLLIFVLTLHKTFILLSTQKEIQVKSIKLFKLMFPDIKKAKQKIFHFCIKQI